MEIRNKEKYETNMANTERYKKSSIPFMQNSKWKSHAIANLLMENLKKKKVLESQC